MISKIIAELQQVADPLRKQASQTVFPTAMNYLGVRSPDAKKLIKEWWIEIKNWPPEKLIVFSKELVATRIFECNQIAFELLWKNKNALRLLKLKDLNELGSYPDNRATTDTFSILISGWALCENEITDADDLNGISLKQFVYSQVQACKLSTI